MAQSAKYKIKLKGLVEDLIKGYVTFISSDILKNTVFKVVEDFYVLGLEGAEKDFNMNFSPNYKTLSFVQTFAFDNVKKLTSDVKDNLRKELSMGLMNGESPTMLKQRVRKVMDITIDRAEVITRTESVRALNMGHYQGAKESGLLVKKQWSTHEDERTCKVCNSLNNQITGIDGKFHDLNGAPYLLSPAHPNCRCRVIYIQPK